MKAWRRISLKHGLDLAPTKDQSIWAWPLWKYTVLGRVLHRKCFQKHFCSSHTIASSFQLHFLSEHLLRYAYPSLSLSGNQMFHFHRGMLLIVAHKSFKWQSSLVWLEGCHLIKQAIFQLQGSSSVLATWLRDCQGTGCAELLSFVHSPVGIPTHFQAGRAGQNIGQQGSPLLNMQSWHSGPHGRR